MWVVGRLLALGGAGASLNYLAKCLGISFDDIVCVFAVIAPLLSPAWHRLIALNELARTQPELVLYAALFLPVPLFWWLVDPRLELLETVVLSVLLVAPLLSTMHLMLWRASLGAAWRQHGNELLLLLILGFALPCAASFTELFVPLLRERMPFDEVFLTSFAVGAPLASVWSSFLALPGPINLLQSLLAFGRAALQQAEQAFVRGAAVCFRLLDTAAFFGLCVLLPFILLLSGLRVEEVVLICFFVSLPLWCVVLESCRWTTVRLCSWSVSVRTKPPQRAFSSAQLKAGRIVLNGHSSRGAGVSVAEQTAPGNAEVSLDREDEAAVSFEPAAQDELPWMGMQCPAEEPILTAGCGRAPMSSKVVRDQSTGRYRTDASEPVDLRVVPPATLPPTSPDFQPSPNQTPLNRSSMNRDPVHRNPARSTPTRLRPEPENGTRMPVGPSSPERLTDSAFRAGSPPPKSPHMIRRSGGTFVCTRAVQSAKPPSHQLGRQEQCSGAAGS